MSSDMRIVKFKMIVGDIWKDLLEGTLRNLLNGGLYTASLAIIYDYDKLNDYGKAIMEQVCGLDEDESDCEDFCELDEDEPDNEDFLHRVEFVKKCKNIEYRIKAAKALVTDLNNKSYSDKEKIKFLFWSLMILSVDDTDKEEHLSLICDFAKMLKIGDEEMMDIVQIIQAIYHMEGNFTIKTRDVKLYFEKVIKRYGVITCTGDLDDLSQMALGMASALALGRKGM